MRDFLTGVRYFGQAFGMLARRPKLLLIGMLPAVLTTIVLLGGMIALIANIDHLAKSSGTQSAAWEELLTLVLAASGAARLKTAAVRP